MRKMLGEELSSTALRLVEKLITASPPMVLTLWKSSPKCWVVFSLLHSSSRSWTYNFSLWLVL